MRFFFKLLSLAALSVACLSACQGGDREYKQPSGYRVTLYLMGGEFPDGTADRVHGGILQPTAMKNVPNLLPGDPYLSYDRPFAAWNTDPYGYGDDYTPETIIDKHVTLYAIYGVYVWDESSLMNMECGNPDVVYVLSNDIIISAGNPWEPLCQDPNTPFEGKLYGDGHTIAYTTRSNYRMPDNSGLFAYASGANIGDLIIEADTTGSSAAGGVVAVADNSVIDKVRVTGTVTAGTETGSGKAGGVAGSITDSKILNCSFGAMDDHGDVSTLGSSSSAGGIVGKAVDSVIKNSGSDATISASSNNSSAGGVVGYLESGAISNCLHAGYVTTENGVRLMAGGIAGRIEEGSEVSFCYADTVVRAPETTANTSAGGIAGYVSDSSIRASVHAGVMVTGNQSGRIAGSCTSGLSNNFARRDTLVNYKTVDDGGVNGTGVAHSAMRKSESFYSDRLGWDFRLYWIYPDHYLFPRLEWEENDLNKFIEIDTADELYDMRDDMYGWYVLVDDIDLSGTTWKSIGGVDNFFYGLLDGNGKTIRNMSGSGAIFSYAGGTKVHDLNLTNVSSYGSGIFDHGQFVHLEYVHVTGETVEGGIAGTLDMSGYISYCSFDGDTHMDESVIGEHHVGGLLGSLENGIVTYSHSTGVAGANSKNDAAYAGGFIGRANNVTAVNNYCLTDAYASGGYISNAGGMFGRLTSSIVVDAYAFGDVYGDIHDFSEDSGYYPSTSTLTPTAGGFVGYAENSDIRNCAALGSRMEAQYYDITDTADIQSRASSFTADGTDNSYTNIYSDHNAELIADTTAGENGSYVDAANASGDFFKNDLGLDFERTWRMPVSGDIRSYPVFQWNRDLVTPADGDEWYWFGIQKVYEEF